MGKKNKFIDWINKKGAVLALAFSNVEKDAFSQIGGMSKMDVNQVTRYTQGQLADSLVNGEVTQEVMDLRWRTYKILKASEGVKTTIIGYDENEMPITKTTRVDNKKYLRKIKQDTFDADPLEMVIDNSEIKLSGNDAMDNKFINLYDSSVINYDTEGNVMSASHGEISLNDYSASHKSELPIKIVRDTTPIFELETYTKKLHVRKISDTERLLEFYVSAYPDEYNRTSRFFISEIKKTIENPRKSSIVDIKGVNFVTYKSIGVNDYLEFEYGDIEFDKIIEFNGHYVIKFKANIVVDARDILSEYVVKSLDEKYDKKEKK